MSYNDNESTLDTSDLSGLKPPDYTPNMLPSSSDQSPLISKKSSRFSCSKDRDDRCQFTLKRLEKIKNWLWTKHQQQICLHPRGCLHVKWLDRSLQHWRSHIRNPFKRWLKCSRKQKLRMHSEHIQAALSVASISAALATVAAATAVSSTDEQHSRTGLAVASAAALVAAHCADCAKQMGADQRSLLASVDAGRSVKHPSQVLELTSSAAASLQATRNALKGRRGTLVHPSATMSLGQMSPFCALSLASSGSHAECLLYNEILARGALFFVRFMADKVHQRFVCVCLDDNKQVILKLTSRHLAGTLCKVEKRNIFQISDNLPSWPGRSLLYSGIERHYFGLSTSQGAIEFECLSNYDHQLWTHGISNLLNVAQAMLSI